MRVFLDPSRSCNSPIFWAHISVPENHLVSLIEDRTETRLMLSLPFVKPHSPHKRSLGILREEKARDAFPWFVSLGEPD